MEDQMKKMRKSANNSEIIVEIHCFILSLLPKRMRKYAKYSKGWIGLTGTIISGNSLRSAT